MSIKLEAGSGGSVSLDAPTQTTNSEHKVYKLPVADGSAGQVLKTDGSGNLSWVTLTDTNDYVKITKATNTGDYGVQYLSLTNLDISTYKFFDLVGYFRPVDDSKTFRFRFRTANNTLADGSVYAYGLNEKKSSNTSNCVAAQGQNRINLTGTTGNAAGEGVFINMRVSFADSSDPTSATYLMNAVTWQATYREQGNDSRHATGEGHYYSAADNLTGFSLFFSTGNMHDFSYCLYGMKR